AGMSRPGERRLPAPQNDQGRPAAADQARGVRLRHAALSQAPADSAAGGQGFVVFSKTITCCHGNPSCVVTCLSGNGVISLTTCFSLILCTNLIGTASSSSRYSTNTSRPPVLSALTMAAVISYGWENSW